MAKKIGSAVIRAVQGVIVAALALVLLANLYTLAAGGTVSASAVLLASPFVR